ncbi:MAG: hypothetical protein HXY37_18595 [Chloroflexi bacterium]|jgi:hypothetical protein|nr:hypothetical protein [Chloroflexota bacterium]
MTEDTTTTNRAIVIGALGALRRRGREATLVSGRTATRGTVGRFALELASPLGDPFALELEVGVGVSGRELLDATAEGSQLVVEGEVLLRASLDPRYARGPDDPGREVRVLAMRVQALRTPRDDEPTASSAVWLEGSVAEPPRRIRHTENRALELATTLLDVVIAERSTYPGSRAIIRRHVQVPIAVPLDHPDAGLLYRPGNRVRVEGVIDCLLEPQRGAAVTAALDALGERYAAQRAQAGGEAERSAAERAERRERRRLLSAPRPIVLVGYVEGLEHAVAMTLDEAAEARRAFVRRLRERRAQRDAQNGVAAPVEDAPDAASAAPPNVVPLRPRRKERDADAA